MDRRDEGKPWRCRVGDGLVPLTTSRRGRLQIVTLGRLGFETAPVLKKREELLSGSGNLQMGTSSSGDSQGFGWVFYFPWFRSIFYFFLILLFFITIIIIIYLF